MSSKPEINKIIYTYETRKNGTIRRRKSFENCTSLAEQGRAHETNINYLMERHQPDELAAYLAAKSMHRTEITDHDFSLEPDLQGARNIIYRSKMEYDNLPDHVKKHFGGHLNFLKFMDNPQNKEKIIKMGLMTEEQINKVTDKPHEKIELKPDPKDEEPTPKKEEPKKKEKA